MVDRLEELVRHLTPAERAELCALLARAPGVFVPCKAAAARLGVHKTTIYRYVAAGTLHGVTVAGRLMILADNLAEAAARPRFPRAKAA
jgi:excisionase family DNA binding protein